MMKLKNFPLILFFLGMQILSANPIQIDGGKDSYTTAFHLQYLEDKDSSLTWEDLEKSEIQQKFKQSETDSLGFGFTDSVFWVVIPYEANIDLAEYILEIDYPLIDKIEFGYKNIKGEAINKRAGRRYLFSEREFFHRNFLFSMKDLNKSGKIYFRFQTESSMQLRIIIHKQKKFWEKEQVELGFQIIFLGIVGSMLFYNLLLGISLRDSTYFYYLFYLISAGLFISGLKGLNYQFLWGNSVAWNHLSGPVLLALTNLGILLFANSFLKLKENLPYLYKVFSILIIISSVCLLSSLLVSYRAIARILVFLVLVNALASILAGFIIVRRGYRPAKIYLVAWGILLLGAYQHELGLARKIQQSIIPRMTPKINGLVIAAWYKPMESIGGDFYDFHQSGENLGFIMADVSGHGVPAALIVSTLKTAFWFQEHNLNLPEKLLLSMNEILKGKAGNEFVTACYGYIDFKNRVLKTSNAGHSDLLIYRQSEGNIIFSNPIFGSQEIQLETGDRILLYTDGLFEVSNKSEELFGEERLCNLLKENPQLPALEFGDLLLRAVMNWSKNKEQLDDDIALIVIDIVA